MIKGGFIFILLFLRSKILEYSSFHIIGESMTFLSGDLTEKIKPKTKNTVNKIIIRTNLSEILFINLIYRDKFFSGVVFS